MQELVENASSELETTELILIVRKILRRARRNLQ